jgi:hypothetical protein
MKIRSDAGGTVSGIRFYKGSSGNNGTHIGMLYTASGALLAQAAFSNESASGWQTVTFSSPVTIAANTTYIAAYFTTSGYAATRYFFSSNGVNNGPLHALPSSAADGGNCVYQYATSPQFPASTWQDSNYWVDVVFTAGASTPPPPPPPTPMPTPTTLSLYNGAATPGETWYPDANPVTLGMKFRSDAAGMVTGMRFWKGDAGNNGTHIALLYTSGGQLLAQAPFTGETSSGWQTVMFSSPVAIAANTTYIAAWFTTSGYSASRYFFSSQGVHNGVLHALQSGVDGPNMMYDYGGAPQFPTSSWVDSNYWVDVLFSVNP